MVKKIGKNVKKKIKKNVSIEKDEEKEEMNNVKSGTLHSSEDIDLQKLSKEIDKELSQNKISSQKAILPNEIIIKPPEKKEVTLYQKLQNQYIKNNFNINIISMITQLINTSKTLPKELTKWNSLGMHCHPFLAEFVTEDKSLFNSVKDGREYKWMSYKEAIKAFTDLMHKEHWNGIRFQCILDVIKQLKKEKFIK